MPTFGMLTRAQPGGLTCGRSLRQLEEQTRAPQIAVSVASGLVLTEATLTEILESKPERSLAEEM